MTDNDHLQADTEELLQAIRDAGAAPAFRVTFRKEPSTGLLHRKVRARYDFHRGRLDPDFRDESGHFIQRLWDGDIGGAWRRADMERSQLILRAFPEFRLLEAIIDSEDCSEDDARRILQEHRERYLTDPE